MTVQCPRCETQYRIPEARLGAPRPVFKCTRCNHVFAADDRPAPARGSASRDAGNLPLPFGRGREPKPTRAGAASEDAEDDLPAVRRGSAGAHDGEEDTAEDEAIEENGLSDTDDEEGDDAQDGADHDEGERPPRRRRSDPAFVTDLGPGRGAKGRSTSRGRRTAAPPPPAPPDDDVDDDVDDEHDDEGPLLIREREEGRAVNPRRDRRSRRRNERSPMRPILVGVATVLAGFLALSALLRQRPELAIGRLAAVPLLGRLVGGDRSRLARLQVTGLESASDRIKGDRPALVVSGKVHNGTGETLRLIEIEARLFADDVERRRLFAYAANQPRKTIHDLSAEEIVMLLRLEPSSRFAVRPGESVGFLLVFPDPPANTTEIHCRIVDALPPERSSGI